MSTILFPVRCATTAQLLTLLGRRPFYVGQLCSGQPEMGANLDVSVATLLLDFLMFKLYEQPETANSTRREIVELILVLAEAARTETH
ncbi:MAG: hypothetical protein M3Q03_14060 [Chloroflexota bacterium]|nr:hypothetical protein [Chloroflexota bacterium]